jgi:DNA mismatch repair protein MutS2
LELINEVAEKPDSHHLCVFDELFSGTNANEALEAATGVLTHLNENYKVRFLVTTHMHALGANLGSAVSSMAMEINNDKATHKIVSGVTDSSGARKTLERIGFSQKQLGEKNEFAKTTAF